MKHRSRSTASPRRRAVRSRASAASSSSRTPLRGACAAKSPSPSQVAAAVRASTGRTRSRDEQAGHQAQADDGGQACHEDPGLGGVVVRGAVGWAALTTATTSSSSNTALRRQARHCRSRPPRRHGRPGRRGSAPRRAGPGHAAAVEVVDRGRDAVRGARQLDGVGGGPERLGYGSTTRWASRWRRRTSSSRSDAADPDRRGDREGDDRHERDHHDGDGDAPSHGGSSR